MDGNVWERCEDWYDDDAYKRYKGGDLSAPKSGVSRVQRGGSWACGHTDRFRCAYRGNYYFCAPDDHCDDHGFRVARTLTP